MPAFTSNWASSLLRMLLPSSSRICCGGVGSVDGDWICNGKVDWVQILFLVGCRFFFGLYTFMIGSSTTEGSSSSEEWEESGVKSGEGDQTRIQFFLVVATADPWYKTFPNDFKLMTPLSTQYPHCQSEVGGQSLVWLTAWYGVDIFLKLHKRKDNILDTRIEK